MFRLARGPIRPGGEGSRTLSDSTTAAPRRIFGAPRDINDPRTYHNVSLIALLAWVGLGADGLSSSAYGPDELYRAIGDLHFLAPALALATAGTVLLISLAYSRIIEHFPFGGGGYVVATRLLGLGRRPGLRLGAARRLRPHHLGVDRRRRRGHLELPAARTSRPGRCPPRGRPSSCSWC